MKRILSLLAVMTIALAASAQKYMTKTGYIGFFSHTPIEDIKADNNQVAGALDAATGDLVFQVLIKSFRFEKALMEEHFNENYMESEKFPKASFKGKITNLSAIDFAKPGIYQAAVEGDLTIRDVTKKVSSKGTVEVVSGGLGADSKFTISPEDYGIKIPGVVRDNIAKNIEVTVSMKYAPVAAK
jgi:polyisoprenoid-binding protein YceI